MTGNQFKKWRKTIMKMSQSQLAKSIGVGRTTIYMIESGQIDVDLRTRLAMAALSMGLKDYKVPE